MNKVLKIAKYLVGGLAALVALLAIVYFLGPRPAPPQFVQPQFENAPSLEALEQQVIAAEKAVPNVKPDCDAHIVWADSTRKEKTKVAMLYLHGFGASHREGYPVNENLAKRFGCNLYLARLSEHGEDDGEGNMLDFTADNYYQSAEKALHIAKQLGDSLVIVATSGGAAMSLFLASRHPEIKAMVLYSPAIRIFRKDAALMGGPWGLEIAHLVTGKEHNDWEFKKPEQRRFWTNHQRFEGIVQFATFQKYAMVEETFRKVKCPVFMGYYYENEEKQDKVVSVAAMKTMFEQLGTPQYLKRAVVFPNAHNHVLTSNLTSDDWQTVEEESAKYLREIMHMTELPKPAMTN